MRQKTGQEAKAVEDMTLDELDELEDEEDERVLQLYRQEALTVHSVRDISTPPILVSTIVGLSLRI